MVPPRRRKHVRHASFGWAALAGASALVLAGLFAAVGANAAEEQKRIACTMTFDLDAWAFLVGSAKGNGTIECDNGQKADASIQVKSVGITFGKAHFEDAKGHFTKLTDIDQIFGSYVGNTAVAGAGGAAGAAGYVKVGSDISLGIAAKGEGTGLSHAWSEITITRR
jgi:hypothetical protein